MVVAGQARCPVSSGTPDVTRLDGVYRPCCVSWTGLGSPSGWMCLEHLSGILSDTTAEQQFYSALLVDVAAPRSEETLSGHLHPQSHAW